MNRHLHRLGFWLAKKNGYRHEGLVAAVAHKLVMRWQEPLTPGDIAAGQRVEAEILRRERGE